ncbi:MAG: hypothetical protein AB4057_05965 [Crocosphaera sp.]
MPSEKIISLRLSDGETIKVEVTQIGEQPVSSETRIFKKATGIIKSIAFVSVTTLSLYPFILMCGSIAFSLAPIKREHPIFVSKSLKATLYKGFSHPKSANLQNWDAPN